MEEILDNLKNYGPLLMLLVGIALIAVSGIYFGVIYLVLDTTNDALVSTNCTIDNNGLVSNCQELFSLSFYPFLALRELLVWFSYVFIFALVFGMLLVGYRSGSSPVLMSMFVAFVGGLTYLGIEISNIYRTMLENAVFRSMMVPFAAYNQIMLNFPWFCFFVGLFSIMIGIVNYQKTKPNVDPEIGNY